MITVAIVEDHPLYTKGLSDALSAFPMQVLWTAANASEATVLMKEQKPQVVLLDIYLPDKSGIQLCKEWKAIHPEVRIIGLTSMEHRAVVKQAMATGMDGYLLKTTDAVHIHEAIVAVTQGRSYLGKEVEHLMQRQTGPSPYTIVPKLTRREKEVLALIVKEHTTQEIAGQLSISATTAETHRMNLISKLGVRNTAGLVRTAIELGLLDS